MFRSVYSCGLIVCKSSGHLCYNIVTPEYSAINFLRDYYFVGVLSYLDLYLVDFYNSLVIIFVTPEYSAIDISTHLS